MSQSRPVYQFNNIIVRTPSKSVVNGLRADDRGNPTFEGVKAEHDAYIAAMKDAGVKVTVLPALEAFPDSIFVEDPALVFTEGAILLRPGAVRRTNTSRIGCAGAGRVQNNRCDCRSNRRAGSSGGGITGR